MLRDSRNRALKPIVLHWVAVAFLLGLGHSGWATTYFVSTTGSNSNDGLTPGSAWRNVQYAANHVAAGDTINILGGVYKETVNIPVSGSATAGYITFQNYAGQTATIDGTGLGIP